MAKKRFFYPLVILIVMLAAFGLQIGRLGFYWDDWPPLFLSRYHSAQAYWDFYLYDRPFSSWTYLLTMPVLGLKPLNWQLFTLGMRWLAVLGWVAALAKVWPRQLTVIQWSGILLAIYPGFTQQAISVAYSQHFITLALFTWSLYAMLAALEDKKRGWLWAALALIFSLLQMLTMEYFVGLELLRPVLIGLVMWKVNHPCKELVGRIIKQWTVYLIPFLLFVVYRFIWLPSVITVSDGNSLVLLEKILAKPVQGLLRLLQIALQDSLHHVFYVWSNLLSPLGINLEAKALWFSWGIGLLASALLVWIYLRKVENFTSNGEIDNLANFYRQAFLFALIAILLGSLPVWASDRQTLAGRWSDRFSLGPMPGATLLLTLIIFWLIQSRKKIVITLSLLAALAISSHVRTANEYAQQWDLQKRYFWQAAWRLPNLKPGTVIFGPEMPLSYHAGYSLGAAYNLVYNSHPRAGPLPYWFIEAFRMEGTSEVPALKPDIPLKYKVLRNLTVDTNTNKALVIHFEPWKGCLQVMDTIYKLAPTLKLHEPDAAYQRLYSMARTDQILAEPVADHSVLEEIFGPEPVRDWCYYFEKADLSRQYAKWHEVIALYAEAEQKNLHPIFGPEFIPLIEAYVHQADAHRAVETSVKAGQLTDQMNPYLCDLWEEYEKKLSASSEWNLLRRKLDHSLKCNLPNN